MELMKSLMCNGTFSESITIASSPFYKEKSLYGFFSVKISFEPKDDLVECKYIDEKVKKKIRRLYLISDSCCTFRFRFVIKA